MERKCVVKAEHVLLFDVWIFHCAEKNCTHTEAVTQFSHAILTKHVDTLQDQVLLQF